MWYKRFLPMRQNALHKLTSYNTRDAVIAWSIHNLSKYKVENAGRCVFTLGWRARALPLFKNKMP